MTAIENILKPLVRIAAIIGVASLLALMALTVVTVVFRAIGIAFPGTYVLSELLLIPTVTFALAYAAWESAHTKVELLTLLFPSRIESLCNGLMLLAGTGFWVFVAIAAIEEAIRRGRQGEVTQLLEISVAPFRWIMVSAICLMIAICVLRGLQFLLNKTEKS